MRMKPFRDEKTHPPDVIYITAPDVPEHPQSSHFLSQLVWNYFWLCPIISDSGDRKGASHDQLASPGVWRCSRRRLRFCLRSLVMKLKPPLVWVTWHWHLVALWLSQLCCTSPLLIAAPCYWFDRENRMIGSMNTKKRVWNVRVAATHTVVWMFNQISQGETFRNGYGPLLKFNKIKYLRVMTVLTYEL